MDNMNGLLARLVRDAMMFSGGQALFFRGATAAAALFGGLLLSTSAALAQRAATDEPSRQQVAGWVAELGAAKLERRALAERMLIKGGAAVLPYLPTDEEVADRAVRDAVTRVRRQIEREAAKATLAPSKVTLNGMFRLDHVALEIERQTGNRCLAVADYFVSTADSGTSQPSWPAAELELNDVEFWPAIDELARQYNVRWQLHESGAIEWRPRAGESGSITSKSVGNHGPFRLEVQSVTSRPWSNNDEKVVLVRVGVRLLTEPRLRPMFATCSMQQVSLTGPVDLKPWNPAAQYELPFEAAARALDLHLDFVQPPIGQDKHVEQDKTAGRDGYSLDAKFKLHVAAVTTPVRFPLATLKPGLVKRVGQTAVRVTEVTIAAAAAKAIENPDPGSQELAIGIATTFETGGPVFESHRLWMLQNRAWLEWADQSRVSFDHFETTREGEGAIGARYRFASPAAATKDGDALTTGTFVYEAPTLMVTLPVRFVVPGIGWDHELDESNE
jgi:hypothetical protein